MLYVCGGYNIYRLVINELIHRKRVGVFGITFALSKYKDIDYPGERVFYLGGARRNA